MRSATSSCNATVIRGDVRHYWPILFVYAGIWMLIQPVRLWVLLQGAERKWLAESVTNRLYEGMVPAVVMTLIFGGLLAMALWSYLMNPRAVGMMHALPIRRSSLFLSHFLTGVGMMTACHVATFLMTLLVESVAGYVDLKTTALWLLVVTVSGLFFFGLGTLCAALTGWELAIPVIYLIANFIVLALVRLLQALGGLFYYGYYPSRLLPPLAEWLTPVMKMAESWYDRKTLAAEGGLVLAVYAAAALVMTVLAWLLYRARHSEAAGDPVAFRALRPVVGYGVGILGGMAFGLLLYEILHPWNEEFFLPGLIVCLLVMGTVWYFGAEMVIRKSFRVFRSGWKHAAAVCLVLAALCVCMELDVTGFSRRLPAAEEVKNVGVELYGYGLNGTSVTCQDDEAIAAALEAHRALIQRGDVGRDAREGSLRLSYTLKNGRMVVRAYNIGSADKGAVLDAVTDLANTDEVRRCGLLGEGAEKTGAITGGAVNGREEYRELTAVEARTLWAALQRDADLGHGVRDLTNGLRESRFTASLEFWYSEGDSIWLEGVRPDCSETIAMLLELGVAETGEELFDNPWGAPGLPEGDVMASAPGL
jgi:ABC-2 type transport system permease protein